MIKKNTIKQRKPKRVVRIRAIVKGTNERPRLSIFRSNAYLYGQVIDDTKGLSFGTVRKLGTNVSAAKELGKEVIELCTKKGVKQLVFDRGGNKYHGVIKTIADSIREGGITI